MQDKPINIAVIGVGLIGGSAALSLRGKPGIGRIVGVDQNEANLTKAVKLGLIDEGLSLEAALASCKVLILSIPVDGILAVLPGLLDQVEDQVVIDMGSTKKLILEQVEGHPKRGRLVASHPMAGTEHSGPEAAFAGLFQDKVMVYTDANRSDEDAFEIADYLTELLEMRTTFMNAEEHDAHTAYISHISHITSMALALTVLEKEKSQGRIFELAGSGFESTVRLAKSSPEMWTPIFKQNRENVLEVLKEHIRQLEAMHQVLEEGNYGALHKLIRKSNKIKRILK